MMRLLLLLTVVADAIGVFVHPKWSIIILILYT